MWPTVKQCDFLSWEEGLPTSSLRSRLSLLDNNDQAWENFFLHFQLYVSLELEPAQPEESNNALSSISPWPQRPSMRFSTTSDDPYMTSHMSYLKLGDKHIFYVEVTKSQCTRYVVLISAYVVECSMNLTFLNGNTIMWNLH